MELETMFTEQKWNILKQLSKQEMSPLQLSEQLDTTMANISLQLKLLQAVNLVKKEKVRNRDRGKPRSLFSLSKDYALIIPTMYGFADKQLMELDDHKKAIMRIWFVKDKSKHYELEKLFWALQDHLKQVNAFFVDQETGTPYIVSDVKNLPIKKFNVKQISRNHLSQLFSRITKSNVLVIYDPEHIIKL